MTPILETDRLWLRPMVADDWEALFLIFSDPVVMDAFHEPPFKPEQMRWWLNRNLAHQEAHGFGLLAVMHKGDNCLIGNCGLEVMDVAGESVCELGYDFRRAYWGQGYATEAATAVVGYAFDQLGLSRLVSMIQVGNEASRRVAEKVGMSLVAEIEQHGRVYWQYERRR